MSAVPHLHVAYVMLRMGAVVPQAHMNTVPHLRISNVVLHVSTVGVAIAGHAWAAGVSTGAGTMKVTGMALHMCVVGVTAHVRTATSAFERGIACVAAAQAHLVGVVATGCSRASHGPLAAPAAEQAARPCPIGATAAAAETHAARALPQMRVVALAARAGRAPGALHAG